jgi:protein-arginine kinase activator protein McsA
MGYNKQQILKQFKKNEIVCVLCNKKDIEIHHKDNNRLNNKKNNLLFLCSLHHKQVHQILKSGKEIKCQKCNYEWIYSGKSKFYVTCPRCYNKTKTKINAKKSN